MNKFLSDAEIEEIKKSQADTLHACRNTPQFANTEMLLSHIDALEELVEKQQRCLKDAWQEGIMDEDKIFLPYESYQKARNG